VISKFIRAALKNDPIPVYGNGSQTRTFCYIDDNTCCVKKILEQDLVMNDVINIGNDTNYTILNLAETIIRLTGSASKVEFLPPLKEGDMSRRHPDTSKMKAIIKKELMPLEAGIRKILGSKTRF
jgi:UDP-glucose 4-epimerase